MPTAMTLLYHSRKAKGLCPRCGLRPPLKDFAVCAKCKAKQDARKPRYNHKAYGRRIREKRRREAIEAYGGACACCGEDHLPYLQLDHINGGGRQERGESYATWFNNLRKAGWPEGLQVLCANCHQAKTLQQ